MVFEGEPTERGQKSRAACVRDRKHRVDHVRREAAIRVGKQQPFARCTRRTNTARVAFPCPISRTRRVVKDANARVAFSRRNKPFSCAISATVEHIDRFEHAARLRAQATHARFDHSLFVVCGNHDRQQARRRRQVVAISYSRHTEISANDAHKDHNAREATGDAENC